MFIQTESTPNPMTMKFLPGREVAGQEVAEFKDANEALKSPLAEVLFKVEGVANLYFGNDFITVTRTEKFNWDVMKPAILTAIMDHFVAGKPVFGETSSNKVESSVHANLTDIEKEIVELIETRVRPAVAMDGGDIVYRGFEDGIVKLQMHGSCSGCPCSTATLKSGIEDMLKHYVPEVIAVEAV